ncbi:TPR repeat protein 25 [Intoshia linei]|uniref:Outer dynein arm-docking complex subunit 4 n=1 Tax=Intoshia linei TaxID=1819745 RepID=A0A177BAK4_9BILA|nr:TPR repeat protein 25 [Intoshia linei]
MFEESCDDTPKCPFEVYKEEADKMNKMGEYMKAIEKYNIALEMRPEDEKCSVARGYCYLHIGDIEKCLIDAIQAFENNSTNTAAICLRAEALYRKGCFEDSLIYFYRGKKIRPDHKAFKIGIQQCEEAIENAVGKNANVKLLNSGDLTQYYENQKRKKVKKEKTVMRQSSARTTNEEKYTIDRKDGKTMKQMLGQLYEDMLFLDELSCTSKNNKNIKKMADNCLEYLDSRSLFWQEQEPMYSRRKKTIDPRSGEKKEISQEDCSKYVLKTMEEIDEFQVNGDHTKSLRLCKKLLNEIKQWNDSVVLNRHEIISNIHSFIGNSHFELGDYENALKSHQVDYEISKQNQIKETKSRAMDNLGRVYEKMKKYSEAVDISKIMNIVAVLRDLTSYIDKPKKCRWEQKIPLIESDIEAAWLYHEISRCYMQMGKINDCIDYAEKSIDASINAKDDVWKISATIILAQAHSHKKNYEKSLNTFNKAKEFAISLDDQNSLENIESAIINVKRKMDSENSYTSKPVSHTSESLKSFVEE